MEDHDDRISELENEVKNLAANHKKRMDHLKKQFLQL
jgi:hypothetical protein